MGIQGLLPLLKEIQVSGNIADFRGKRLAVDAYVWLHKGAFGCAEELVKGKKTTKFVDYAMYRVRMLRYHGITPYIVFDGGPLPAKQGTEDSRAKSRADHLSRAQAFEAQGRAKDARDCYTKCLDITPEMAYQFIKALRAESVDYVVAPYEADAQLCYLEREGYVDGIITEDSDLLVFGCKLVIFKLEKDGSCVSVERSKLATVRDLPMHGWTDVQFRRMAMLSGCDYLPSINGIGLKKAHRMLRRFKTVEKLLQSIRLDGSHEIPENYAADFAQAELAFVYQRVFCPERQRLVPLTNFPDEGLEEQDEKWVGLDVDTEIAQGMSKGDLHPATRVPIEDLWPNFNPEAGKPSNAPGLTEGTVPKGKGTLDGFVTRVKRTKSTPAVHEPIGKPASGPTRLSDLPSNALGRRASEPSPQRTGLKRSKFFSNAPPELPPLGEPEEEFDLEWEESDDVESQSQGGPKLASPEHVRSPSPFVSTMHPTPHATPLPIAQGDGDIPITSPVSVVSGFSSPPGSTPPRAPKNNRRRSEPSPSPTPPARVLVAASSQIGFATQATAVTTVRCLTEATSTESFPSPTATPVRHSRKLSRMTSILEPQRALGERSSDSVADEDIVTPSGNPPPLPPLKRKREPVKVERGDDEEDLEEAKREARARAVAEGWKAKYALGAALSSSPARVPLDRKPALPRSATRVALAPRQLNIQSPAPVRPADKGVSAANLMKTDVVTEETIDDAKGCHSLPAQPRIRVHVKAPKKVESPAPVAAAAVSTNPHGLSWSALERFRFTRTPRV